MWQEKLKIIKTNPIAGLYPFTKMWIMGLFSFSSIILVTCNFHGYPFYSLIPLAVLLILAAATGISVQFMSIFSKIFFLAVIILAAQALLFPGEILVWSIPVFNFFTLRIFENGLQKGLSLAFTVLNIGGIFTWFFQCTANKEIVCACEKRGMSPKAGYVLLSTLQMITVLQQSSKIIMSAQEARGVETKGSLKTRMKAFMPSLIPLVLGAINNTEERVLTLEARGFTAKCRKTRLFDVEPNGREGIALTAAVIFAIAAVAFRIVLWVL